MIEILRSGVMTTVQDGGRHGRRSLGVTGAGALDPLSLSLANLLVGNPSQLAALEMSLMPVKLRFEQATRIALTGAEVDGRLDDGTVVRSWWSYSVDAGQTLTLNSTRPMSGVGLHTYLAVAGGIDVPEVLGSRSTDLTTRFGGYRGRALANGDRLPVGDACAIVEGARNRDGVLIARPFGIRAPRWFWPKPMVDGRAPPVPVRFLPGPEWEDFSLVSRRLLSAEPWEVSPRSNRMGYRLIGPRLLRLKARQRDLLSHGVLPGVIQVPPDGQPIVLLADAQTTGGYPKIGVVISADLPIVAQVRFGASLQFVPCDLAQARDALRLNQRYLQEVAELTEERLGRPRQQAAPTPPDMTPSVGEPEGDS